MEHLLYAQHAFLDILRTALWGNERGNCYSSDKWLTKPWLICHGVKHSMTPVHGDKLLATWPSLPRSLWTLTKTGKRKRLTILHLLLPSPSQALGNVSEGNATRWGCWHGLRHWCSKTVSCWPPLRTVPVTFVTTVESHYVLWIHR